jgi:hypothetical protein
VGTVHRICVQIRFSRFFRKSIPNHYGAQRRPVILLRSSWQVVNIGDIAHTPGVLALLEALRDDAKAEAFLTANNLERGQFLCCLSRLRYTLYWTIPGDKRAFDQKRHDRNEQMKEQDHQPIRDAMINVVRETSLKVLLCPEDMTQMAVGREMLFNKFPDDVKPQVVWRPDFWLTDEALSVYRLSAGLFGSEMHSPIMAVGNGIPAIVCRFEEQTSKGLMWKDIGLGDWLFDFDLEADRNRMPAAVLQMAQNLATAQQKTAKAQAFVRQRQKETMQTLVMEVTRLPPR